MPSRAISENVRFAPDENRVKTTRQRFLDAREDFHGNRGFQKASDARQLTFPFQIGLHDLSQSRGRLEPKLNTLPP
jgi:hypothetical protein